MAEKRKVRNQTQRAKSRDKSTIDSASMTDCNCYGDSGKNRIGKNLFIKKKARIIQQNNDYSINSLTNKLVLKKYQYFFCLFLGNCNSSFLCIYEIKITGIFLTVIGKSLGRT